MIEDALTEYLIRIARDMAQVSIEDAPEQCSFCNQWMAADGSDHAGGEYGFDFTICRDCIKEHIIND